MFVFSKTHLKILGVGLLGIFLTACDSPSQPESTASTDPATSVPTSTPSQTGKAVIRLPAFPAGTLVKTSAQTGISGAPGTVYGCTFVLTINIPGRQTPMIRSWNLLTNNGPLVVDHIPVGTAEFTGHLVTAAGDVTHSGSVTAIVAADQIVNVNMMLKSEAVGDAAICIDVEGLPASGCAISNPISLRVLSTCWSVSRTLRNNNTESGLLRVNTGAGEGTTGVITWDTPATDTVSNLWADVKWGMMGFTVDYPMGGAWSYQGLFQQDQTIQAGTIEAGNGMTIGRFSATPMDCPE